MGFWNNFTEIQSKSRARVLTLPLLSWLGGFMYTWNVPGNTFWDGFIWVYYVGRFVAMHFTSFTY